MPARRPARIAVEFELPFAKAKPAGLAVAPMTQALGAPKLSPAGTGGRARGDPIVVADRARRARCAGRDRRPDSRPAARPCSARSRRRSRPWRVGPVGDFTESGIELRRAHIPMGAEAQNPAPPCASHTRAPFSVAPGRRCVSSPQPTIRRTITRAPSEPAAAMPMPRLRSAATRLAMKVPWLGRPRHSPCGAAMGWLSTKSQPCTSST